MLAKTKYAVCAAAFLYETQRRANKERAEINGLTWGFITCFVRGMEFQIYTILAFSFYWLLALVLLSLRIALMS